MWFKLAGKRIGKWVEMGMEGRTPGFCSHDLTVQFSSPLETYTDSAHRIQLN